VSADDTDDDDEAPAAVECAHCGRRLRDDGEWLWWRPQRDAAGELRMYCGECDDDG
jgi:hypothetical protein